MMHETVSSLREPVPGYLLGDRSNLLVRGAACARSAAGSVPPTVLVFLSMLSVQLGAAGAKGLFTTLGAQGTVFVRITFAALVLLALWRPRLRGYSRSEYTVLILFGLTIAGMNASFYAAIARLPLGIAVTLEFVGPLGVALAGSRRLLDVVWGVLAAIGVLLLAPLGSGNAVGVLFALTAGVLWGVYILLNVRVGRVFAGNEGLALAMGVATVAITPLGLVGGGMALLQPHLLLLGAGVAVLSTIIPFSLEHTALKRIPARVFGVLMSAEPAIAAAVGLALLSEAVGLRGLLALGCVSAATIGSARPRSGGP